MRDSRLRTACPPRLCDGLLSNGPTRMWRFRWRVRLREFCRSDRRPRDRQLAEPPAGRSVEHRPATGLDRGHRSPPALPRRRTSRTAPRPASRRPARAAGRAPARPGTLWWISALGSRSASVAGVSRVDRRAARVSERGPARSRQTQAASRPSSSQVPSTSDPARRQRAGHRRPGRRHPILVVLAQHVERPHHHRPQPGQLEAAAGERQPRRVGGRRGGGHPRRVDLQPDHPHVGPHPGQPRPQLDRGHRGGAVAEVDHQRIGGVPQRGPAYAAIQLSTRRSRLGLVVPRVMSPCGRVSSAVRWARAPPCAGRPGPAGGPRAGRC